MKAQEMREQSVEELEKSLADFEEQLFKLRFQKSTGQVDDTTKIRQVRKNIARALTVLNERRARESEQ